MNTMILIAPNHIYSTRRKTDYYYNKGDWKYAGSGVKVKDKQPGDIEHLNDELNYGCNSIIKQNLNN